jgi:hypothetical protein
VNESGNVVIKKKLAQNSNLKMVTEGPISGRW